MAGSRQMCEKEMSHQVAQDFCNNALRPDTDVLLAKYGFGRACASFFSPWSTRKSTARRLSANVFKDSSRDSEQLKPADLTVAVSHSFLAPISSGQKRIDGNLRGTSSCCEFRIASIP